MSRAYLFTLVSAFVCAIVPVAGVPARAADTTPWAPYVAAFARPPAASASDTSEAARARVGRLLFFDPRLSRPRTVSCATCHDPALAWSDGLPRAVGHAGKVLARRTPTIVDAGFAAALFWDGRAETLEAQALGPLTSPDEMGLTLEELTDRLASIASYAPLLRAAYPGEPISPAVAVKAIASFERTVVSGPAPFDRFVDGDPEAISPSARRGFVVFNTTGHCAACHSGWRFTDDGFYDIGVPGSDPGRGKLVPLETMQHAFKTPTLRNVDRRAPYMHDGSEPTLAAVLELYDLGGRERRPSLSPEIRPLHLSAQNKTDLLAFLHTLASRETSGPGMALPEE